MSRDWYIKTDTRNIQETFADMDAKPLTFKEKWQQNKKKYILWAVEIAALLGVMIAILPSLLVHNAPDYTLTLVTDTGISDETERSLKSALTALAKDRDEDGEIEVEIRQLVLNEDVKDGKRHSAAEQLTVSFCTPQYTFFAMQPSCYQRHIGGYAEEELFRPIHTDRPLNDSGTLLMTEANAKAPTLLWGVRALEAGEEKWETAAKDHLALLEAFVESGLAY